MLRTHGSHLLINVFKQQRTQENPNEITQPSVTLLFVFLDLGKFGVWLQNEEQDAHAQFFI